jgi:hypothetical protein
MVAMMTKKGFVWWMGCLVLLCAIVLNFRFPLPVWSSNTTSSKHIIAVVPVRLEASDTEATTNEFLGKATEQSLLLRTSRFTNTTTTTTTNTADCFHPRPINLEDISGLPPKPWVHLGLPKSGTTSLEHFWKCGGLDVSHCTCKVTNDFLINEVFHGLGGDLSNRRERKLCAECMQAAKENNLPILQSCGNSSAYAQMDNGGIRSCFWPQLSALDEIHQDSPNATFVFMFRNVDSWIQSFMLFRNGEMHREFKKCKNILYTKTKKKGSSSKDRLKQFMCDVVNHARNFVAAHPSHQLLEIDLDNPETGTIVSKLFGINDSCWGAHNVNKKIDRTTTQDT